MKALAEQAHEPAVEGVFHDRSIHEADRRAKYGTPRVTGPVNSMPAEGLIPNKAWKIQRASSESRSNGRLASCAIDGDPRTHWHTQFQPKLREHPHELVIDLGAEHTIRGFRYLARQDAGWNGALKDCEFYVSDSPDEFGKPVAEATFSKSKEAQDAKCAEVRGRYVRIRILSEVNGQPWASIAELGVVGE